MQKMLMVVYNEALDDEVMAALDGCAMKNYTKIPGVFGRGAASGTHLGNDVWPGRNNILYAAADEAHVVRMVECVRDLRKRFGSEGIKGFVVPLEQVT